MSSSIHITAHFYTVGRYVHECIMKDAVVLLNCLSFTTFAYGWEAEVARSTTLEQRALGSIP